MERFDHRQIIRLIPDDENFWILPFHKVNKFFYALPFAYTGRCDIKAAARSAATDRL